MAVDAAVRSKEEFEFAKGHSAEQIAQQFLSRVESEGAQDEYFSHFNQEPLGMLDAYEPNQVLRMAHLKYEDQEKLRCSLALDAFRKALDDI